MATLVCFISNSPENLELSLYPHSANFTADTRVLILDTHSTHEKNAAIAREFNAIHVSEEDFKEKAKDEFKPLFQGRYGGNRNICLYYAFKENANAVFFDDDTTPCANPVAQYEKLFAEGRKIVVGKYLRHAAGAQQMIKELVETACAYGDKEMAKEKAQEKLWELFAGMPSEASAVPRGMGMVGGNAGIHFEALRQYCFFPTDYRVEDGTYATLAHEFVGEEPFNSEGNPAVFHNKRPRANALLENLDNELKGNVIALCVKDSFEENELSMDTLEEKIARNASLAFKAFNLDYLQYKQRQKGVLEKARELGFEKEFAFLLSLDEKSFAPSPEEVKRKMALFAYAQENWENALKE
ncbi:hypothetical protein J4220_00455 [Candidatus Micrarchaeota archaeon]|nr:hypothetical protein [Candidatus Micrarchaeota archaeon]